MNALLLVLALAAAPSPGSTSRAPVVAVRGFNAINLDAVTAGLLTQRFAAGLARSGIYVVSLAELARTAPEERRAGIQQCAENSEPCRATLRALGVDALLYGTASFIDFQWRFAATALDMRDGSTLASISEVHPAQSGLEQRLDFASGRFGDQIASNLAHPVSPKVTQALGRNVVSLAPVALVMGALYLEYERVLTDRFSVTVAPGVENLFPALVTNPFTREGDGLTPRLELSLRYYPQGTAPQQCWLSLGANGELETTAGELRYGGAALVGCSVALPPLLGTAAIGAAIDHTGAWGLDGRFHLGWTF